MATNKQIRISITSALNAAGIEATRQQVDAMGKAVEKSMREASTSNRRHWADIKAAWDMGFGALRKLAGGLQHVIAAAFKFETALANFKTLTGSIDEARRHIADLRSFSASNPLTFDDVSNASKTMLSFGISVKDIMPSLKMLGDISLGQAEKFKGLALVFGQVKSAGRLMGQDLLQMINQGFNPLTIISQETGRSMVELKEIMEDGGISFEMVAAAMQKATQEGGLFHDALKNSAETGDGMMAKAKDTWDETIRTVGGAFSEAAKDGIGEFTEKLDTLNRDGTIEVWANKVMEAFNTIKEGAAATGKALGWLWEKTGLSDLWAIGKGTIQSVGYAVTRTAAGIANGEGVLDALSAANREGGEVFAKNVARGHWLGKVAERGWLGSQYKWAAEDNKSDDQFEARKEDLIRKRAIDRKRQEANEEIAGETKKRTLREMFDEAEQAKAAKEAEEKAAKEEKAQKKAAERIAAERERLDRQEAARRERERQREIAAAIQAHKQILDAERAAEEQGRAAVSAADAKLQQAWGWYRDKEAMAAQMKEEKADAEARKQFEKDFERLKSRRRDWRKAENLSVDDEAVRRVALAREEKMAAERHLAEIERNTSELAAKLDELLTMKGGE